jgi:hypothetical protein
MTIRRLCDGTCKAEASTLTLMLVGFGPKELPALTQSPDNVSWYPKKLPALSPSRFAIPLKSVSGK